MRPDDDDGPEMGGGPPPDPSLRSWRHPSEIAAAAAAARRPIEPKRPVHPFLSRMAVLGALVVMAAASALVLGTAIGLRTDHGPDAAMTEQALLSSANSTASRPSSTRPPSDSDGGEIGGGSSAGATGSQDPVAGDTTVDQTQESEETTTIDAAATSPVSDVDELLPDLRSTAWFQDEAALERAYIGVGVYGEGGEDGIVRLASFFVMDDLVFTSASALGGADQVILLTGDVSLPASVIGADGLTDVAVLAPEDGTASLPVEAMLADSGSGEIDSGMPLTVTVPTGPEEPAATDGLAIGDVRRTTVASGAPVYDLLLTTIRRPEGSSGAPVLDDQGNPVGMVVDTPGYLTRVVPIDVVASVGAAYVRWGAASEEWLGVEGATRTPSGAEILTIEPGSPAEEAGLLPGDVITGVDGEPVTDWYHLVYLVRRAGAGSAVILEVERNEAPTIIGATVGARLPSGG